MQSTNVVRRTDEPQESSEAAAISGVELKELRSFPDQRGFFREVIRSSDSFFGNGFAQWSHSCMQQHTVKAWHFHHKQIDWWYCPIGLLQVALYDARPESPTFETLQTTLLGQPELDPKARCAVVKIPQGVLHGCKVLSDQAHLFYITSEHYNPEDEGRIPFDSTEVPYHWGNAEELIVAEKDRVHFLPPHTRQTVVTSA